MTLEDIGNYFLSKKVPYAKPLYAIDIEKDSDILDWFRETEKSLGQYYRPLFCEQRENLQYFTSSGINPNFVTPYAAVYAVNSMQGTPDLFINDMFRVTMAAVVTVVSHDLIPDVLPNSEDYSDKVACNVTKEWLESMNYDLNTEAWRFRWELQKKLFGESFVIPLWNPNIGDIHPMAKEYMDEDLDLLDEDGQVMNDIGGKPMKVRKGMRIGDIEYVSPMPWDVQIDPQNAYQDSNWFYWKDYVDVEYLKKKYPKYSWDGTKDNKSETKYDSFSGSEKDNPNKRTIYYLFHKSHEFMPEGRYIIATKEHVLLNHPLKMPTIINNQDLPLVRFTDLDIGLGVRGVPIFFRNGKNIVDGYNRVSNQMFSNIEMESPKIFVHRSSGVDAQRMPNGTVAVEWDGNIKPTIETPSTNTAGIFNFREALKKNIDEMSMQTPMVRGDVPNAQLDSFVSLQYFEDLRNLLATPDIKGHIRSMEHLYRLMITVAKDRYKPDDGRLIKILGKHNTYQLKYFDPINLQKSYDVKITTTGNLATSRAARNQMLLNIKRDFPNLIGDEVFLDMLGLSHSKKFMNAVTSAVSSAEAENQSMMEGTPVKEPARFEDLITHWETHKIPMQTLDFKESPEEIQDLFIGHVALTEKLMFEQAAENPSFGARLEALRQFPMFYTPKPVNEPPPQMDAGMMEQPIQEQMPEMAV